ncbi:ABC transporter substrate-binding protein [Microbacterium nymphoidis]|uniref:ABC transporter substrate-binding protein n=1 Tax=Microbacterium nymphoidis TaxID=2898586 RepID=UPI001E285698|nr:extracellular solute-binding protein [Microbacterium nymphoidis]MCD2498847.1 extracellular solute-binding protein [Microbacterium nymphoidis]
MQARPPRITGATIVTAALGIALVACSPATDPQSDPAATGSVTIRVGEMPTADQAASLKVFTDRVAEFEKRYPNITVVGDETRYDPQSFSALLVGGTAPTTLAIPFTDMTALIQRGQAADITDLVERSTVLSGLNPDLDDAVVVDGRTYGVVRQAYEMSLMYNRALYAQAGLDPNTPPTDWEGVLENAKTIAARTGKTGFIIPTTGNNGGWLLTTMAYANGSLVETVDKDGAATVTVDTAAMKSSLQFLHDLRWDADAAGSNFLLSPDDIRNEYAGGNVAQTINGPIYTDVVVNRGMDKDDIGIAPMPQGAAGLGTLGGGAIQWYNPKASPEELDAALKWTEFYWLDRYFDKDTAISLATAAVADNVPVGIPEIPLVSDEQYETYLGWIADSITVDRSLYTDYLSSKLTVNPEPAVKAQELYAALDPIVQAVLTDEKADVDALLAEAQKSVQAVIDAG